MAKLTSPPRSDTEIRHMLLQYFYDRNKNARSARSDKSGVAAKISVVYRDLKRTEGLAQPQVRRNLTYLISEGWVEPEEVIKSVPLKSGTIIPQATTYYKITAAGIDKIEGPGEFTMPKYQGIKIEATGQNIITVGDGNQVDARHRQVAGQLADLKQAVIESAKVSEGQKLSVAADIETIQAQLAKSEPNKTVISSIWSGIEKTATLAGLTTHAAKIAGLLSTMF